MGKKSRAHYLKILKRRAAYLKKLIDDTPDKPNTYEQSELAALEWVFQFIEMNSPTRFKNA